MPWPALSSNQAQCLITQCNPRNWTSFYPRNQQCALWGHHLPANEEPSQLEVRWCKTRWWQSTPNTATLVHQPYRSPTLFSQTWPSHRTAINCTEVVYIETLTNPTCCSYLSAICYKRKCGSLFRVDSFPRPKTAFQEVPSLNWPNKRKEPGKWKERDASLRPAILFLPRIVGCRKPSISCW